MDTKNSHSGSNRQIIRYFLIMLVFIIFSLISCTIFNIMSARTLSAYDDQISFYQDAKYDFVVSNPSESQIEQFKNDKNADEVAPAYLVNFYVSFSDKSQYEDALLLDNYLDLQFTDFSDKRILFSKSDTAQFVYVDYTVAKKMGLKIGSFISIETTSGAQSFEVTRIYRENERFVDGLMFLPITNEIKPSLEKNNALFHNLAFISSNSHDAFYSDCLNGYLPLGTLKNRDSFSSDDAYKNYLTDFYSKDYSSYIYDNSGKLNQVISKYNNDVSSSNIYVLIGSFVSAFLNLSGSLSIFLLAKKKILRDASNNGANEISRKFLTLNIASVSFWAILLTLTLLVISISLSHFYSFINMLSLCYLDYIIPVSMMLIVSFIEYLIMKKS
jgi:hypothetical protein